MSGTDLEKGLSRRAAPPHPPPPPPSEFMQKNIKESTEKMYVDQITFSIPLYPGIYLWIIISRFLPHHKTVLLK